MFPDLVDLGFLHLRTYGACMAIGFLLAWKLVEVLSGRKDLSNLLIALIFSGIIGSRTAYVIEHWQLEFAAHPERIIRVDQGGLMFYGGLILAILVFFAWCLLKKEPIRPLGDLLVTVIPLAHAFGRFGCFCYGCCYGKDSTAWYAVTFPRGSPSWFEHGRKMVSVIPTQLIEAAALLLLFAALYWVYRKFKAKAGFTSGLYLCGYAVIRFGVEYLRGDPRAAVGPFSISQTISMAMFLIGGLFIATASDNRR